MRPLVELTKTPPSHRESGGVTSSELAERILEFIRSHANSLDVPPNPCRELETRHWQMLRIQRAIEKKVPIELVILGFPAKSANRQKTLSDQVDYGEVMALQHLNGICRQLGEIYEPGARIHLCSDGHVFSNLVGVNDELVDRYHTAIGDLCQEFGLGSLKMFSLRQFYRVDDHPRTRRQMMQDFSEALPSLKARVASDLETKMQFNGIHRFLFEDFQVQLPYLSKTQVRNMTKELTYQVIQHSNAFSRLVEVAFPDALRLSIHPQPLHSWKIGIKLIPGSDRWATPWHNVLLKTGDSSRLVPHREARALGAKIRFLNNKYAFFETVEKC